MRVTRERERKIGQRITVLKEIIQEELAKKKTIREVARNHDINECTLGFYIRYWKTGLKGKQIGDPGKKIAHTKRRYIRIDKRKKPDDKKKKKYRYMIEETENTKELLCILAAGRVIHWSIFIKNVEQEFLDKWISISGQALAEDPEVNYYRSVTEEGREVYYFTHRKTVFVFY